MITCRFSEFHSISGSTRGSGATIGHDDVIKLKHFPRYGPFVRWIPLKKASDAGLWCFLWSAPEQMELSIETPVIWDAIALIMTSL